MSDLNEKNGISTRAGNGRRRPEVSDIQYKYLLAAIQYFNEWKTMPTLRGLASKMGASYSAVRWNFRVLVRKGCMVSFLDQGYTFTEKGMQEVWDREGLSMRGIRKSTSLFWLTLAALEDHDDTIR